MKNELSIFEHREHAVVSIRNVAKTFGKRHDNILYAISELKKGILESKETLSQYFIKSQYESEQNGQTYPEYLCTRDGFSLLVMGFNGQKALE